MWSRLMCIAAISFGLISQTVAGEQSDRVHRASCTVVRFYVAQYSASAAEAWARRHGATDAEIEAVPALSCADPNRAMVRAVNRRK